MRLMPALLLFLFAAPLLAADRSLPESNVLGEPCPELLLEEEMVQGEQITWDSLQGKAVLFLFYQRECDGCEREAMPRIQKMHEKWAGSHCWLVFVINTAFDKDVYPYVADVKETRKHLQRMEWTMPVARDLDELSNELFTLDDQPGVPQAVVMDEHGIVRAHDWYSEEEEEMKRVDNVFEGIASSMNCKCARMPREVTRNCQGARDAFKEGRYQDAYTASQDILDGTGYGKEDKNDAEYLQKFIDDTAATRMDRIKRHFERDPVAALHRADEAITDFAGARGVQDFATQVEGWRGSRQLATFRADRKTLARMQTEISRGGARMDQNRRNTYVKRLDNIAKRGGRTTVADSARNQSQRLSGARSNKTAATRSGGTASNRSSGGGNRASSSGGGTSNSGGNTGKSGRTSRAAR